MDSDSKVGRRRVVKEGLRKLRAKPGWDPAATSRPSAAEELNRVSELGRADRLQSVASTCEACLARQAELNDATAYCDDHMREILGF